MCVFVYIWPQFPNWKISAVLCCNTREVHDVFVLPEPWLFYINKVAILGNQSIFYLFWLSEFIDLVYWLGWDKDESAGS